MPKPIAVLVEDEEASAAQTRVGLEKAGFDVIQYRDASSAMNGLSQEQGRALVDLIVLDRKLPMRLGEVAPDNQIGDDLLSWTLECLPAVPVVVFSGHSTYEHLQFAVSNRGTISLRNGDVQVDPVTPFRKSQLPEFDAYTSTIFELVASIDDVQVVEASGALPPTAERELRRVAYEFGGVSIRAKPLVGGLTDAPVWLCSVDGSAGPIALVVAKRLRKKPQAGGFQAMVPASLAANTFTVVTGFCGGTYICVQGVAGGNPQSLLDLIASAPPLAAEVLTAVQAGLAEVPLGDTRNVSISEIAAPIADWDTVVAEVEKAGLPRPRGSQIATTRNAAQHGDLHPGNVLVSNGHPVIIDFDSQTYGSALNDAVNLLLGPIFHRDSPLKDGLWPLPQDLINPFEQLFLVECPAPEYIEAAAAWARARSESERELFAVVLAYAARQLKYDDVKNVPVQAARAKGILRWAAQALAGS